MWTFNVRGHVYNCSPHNFPDEVMRLSMLHVIKETQWVALIQQCIHIIMQNLWPYSYSILPFSYKKKIVWYEI